MTEESPEFCQNVSEYIRNLKSGGIDFANETNKSIDRWTLAITGAGIAFSFAALHDKDLAEDQKKMIAWLIVFFSLSMFCSLASSGFSYLSALHVVEKSDKAIELETATERLNAASLINWNKYFKWSFGFGTSSLVFLGVAIVTISISSLLFVYGSNIEGISNGETSGEPEERNKSGSNDGAEANRPSKTGSIKPREYSEPSATKTP